MSYQSDLNKVTRTSSAEEFPEVILIDNLNACNLTCSMCDHKNMVKHRPVKLMDMGLYKKIIDEIARVNPHARIWEIYFGDPFLCKDMAERVEYAKNSGLTDVVLNTNGVLMTPERSKALIMAGLDAIYVGIDAFKEETYNQIRIGGDYQTVVKNVLKYRELLSEYGSETQQIFVQFVVSDINESEVQDFRNFWVQHGISVKIRPKVSWAGLVEATNLRPNDEAERKPCYWLVKAINICSDGEVTLCSVDVHCRVKCGNVNEKSIQEIWQGDLKKYRDMHSEGRYDQLPALCANCRDWQSTYAEFY